MPVLLIVDDESSILHAFGRVFSEPEFTLRTADSGTAGLRQFREHRPDVVILDVQLPDVSGLELFSQIRAIDSKVPVIFITGHGSTDTAIEATKQGAYDYLFKPLELRDLRKVVDGACAIAHLQSTPTRVADDSSGAPDVDLIVGRSPAMNEVYKAIGRVAPQNMNVLLAGESGTGKELVARAIYHHSQRSAAPFLAINCAAIPDTILESELFGHEKGAFTGAERQRIGKFEQCSGGTLFLDEVGDMSPTAQAKTLRVIEEQRFERVGGNETIQTDVRLIAATNRDLKQLVAAGEFREDLYFRLSVFTIELPRLRDRGDDLAQLVRHFVQRFSRQMRKQIVEIAPETVELLGLYSWPGNVRELQSVVKQTLLRAVGTVLIPEFLPDHIRNWESTSSGERPDGSFDEGGWDAFISQRLEDDSENLYAESALVTDRHLLMRVLRQTGGNQLKAARMLGISRATLRNKLRAAGIKVDEISW